MTGLNAFIIGICFLSSSTNLKAESPAQWKLRCINDLFCFTHPESLKPIPAQIKDSIAGSMQSEHLKLSYDYGFYAQIFADFDYNRSQTSLISGYNGHKYFGDREVFLTVPEMPNKLRFSMKIAFSNKGYTADAEKILNSVYFTETK